MNILLAVDGSDISLRAARGLISFAAQLRESPQVHLLHVHLPIPIGFATRHVAHETLDRYYREEGEAILVPFRTELEAAGLPVKAHVHVGPVGETVAHVAHDLGCQQIWLGTHGRGSVTQALLGSVAARVVALAGCPVTLVR